MPNWLDQVRFIVETAATDRARQLTPPAQADTNSPVQWKRCTLKPMNVELWQSDGTVSAHGQIQGLVPDFVDFLNTIVGPQGVNLQGKRFWFSHYDENVIVYTEAAAPAITENERTT